jgi:hypothetical protein
VKQPFVSVDTSGVTLHTPAADGWTSQPLLTAGRWPVWNPRRELLAISVSEQGAGTPRSAIRLVSLDGRDHGQAYLSPLGVPPVIAPRIPHYANWSPRGDLLSFAAPATDGLGLFITDADGAYSADAIRHGGPLFSAWRSDGEALAIHVGSDLEVYFPGSRDRLAVSSRAVGFRTPVWVGESLVYVVPAGSKASLVSWDAAARAETELARFESSGVLQGRPGSSDVSVALSDDGDSGAFGGLWLVDTARPGSAPRQVSRDPFVSAFWAPDGKAVALIVPTQMGDGRYFVQVLDANGHYVAATEGFVPGQDLRLVLAFFDQYSLSHHLWAPDSSAMLLAGRLAGDGVAASFSDPVTDSILYWEVRRSSPLEVVARGDSAFFAPPGPQ